jgi:DNA polymerase III delta prime subunit
MKVFISYSHKDEKFREELNTHLSLMKRNGEIETWDDRKIIPGEEWSEEIANSLETADIILLLVSSDFINSDYCFDIEVARAIEKHNEKTAIVIPVLLRICDWKSAPFSKLQALPTEALPIKKWEDSDEAWNDVVNGIRDSLVELKKKTVQVVITPKLTCSGISSDFLKWLDDTEVQLSHRNVEKVQFLDVYVAPHLKNLISNSEEIVKPVDAISKLNSESHLIIFGDDQSGKTSLIKHYYRELYGMGALPIFIDGECIKSSDLTVLINKKIAEQYDDSEGVGGDRVLLIDNFSKIKLNQKHLGKLLENINDKFHKIIFLAHDSFQFVAPEIDGFGGFEFCEILPLGNLKRSEVIEKWVSLGISEQIDDKELYKEADEIKLRMDSMVRGNVVPAKPIFILTMLQMFEAYTPQNLELTSYGHCYQYLVYQALEKAKIKASEIDLYLNILTELSWEIYKNKRGLNKSGVSYFFSKYRGKYVLGIDDSVVIDKIISNGILYYDDEGLVSFKYKYVYYFFVAKKIAESFSLDDVVKDEIRVLLSDLHREEAANIIIFISHHTKESWILDELQLCLMELFEDQSEAELSYSSLSFMDEFIAEIPDLILREKEVSRERNKRNELIDDLERMEGDKVEERFESNDFLVKINKVFKGIEIVGQIVRNRHASLNKEVLFQMIEFSTHTGLRFLQYFIEISDVSKEEVIKTIKHMLIDNVDISDDDLEKEARSAFLKLTYGIIYGVLKKISTAIGSKDAYEIYTELEEKTPTPAVKLINQAIALQFKKQLDFKKLSKIHQEFSTNPVCERILKEIVVQHAYMFPVDYKDKQKISSILNVSVQGQTMMDLQKKLKV